MYTGSILWMLSWPVVIFISLLLVWFVIKKYESRQTNKIE